MGIIKAAVTSIGGALADQWLETIEPAQIDNTVVATYGILVRRKGGINKKRTEDVISNGSIIHVPENTYMLLVDGGKIISGTDEPGYYQVDNSREPSIFFKSAEGVSAEPYSNTGANAIYRPGGLINTIKQSWERFKFGGTTPVKQSVVYINKQEITGIRFGTRNPVSYTDRVLVPGRVVPCKITSFGTYSIKIADPLLFYYEVCNKTGKSTLTVDDMSEQYVNEFLMAYTTALASLSADNVLISDITMKTMELGHYMAEVLDNEWLEKRGFYINSVGIAGISFDERTNQLLEKYANDSILYDPNARAARVTAAMASGVEAAGSNPGGSMVGFAGVNMGMNSAALGMMLGQQGNTQNVQTAASNISGGEWTCTCGTRMPANAKFCSNCGSKKPEQPRQNGIWNCSCGQVGNNGMFCPNCGRKRP